MHFLELLEQVSDRDTAVYYAENCDEAAPKASYSASKTLIDGNYSFTWAGTKQGHEFWAKIHEKLSTHPQNQKVTYELNVYEQYKNEVFEDVKAVIPKMKHICELLEELFDEETAIKFANNAIKKPHLHSKVLTEKNAINSLLWENTPEGDVFWRVIHKQLSSTDKVSMCMDTFKEYASKDVQHALETKQTKTTKKETFMSKLKTTTLNTLEQNKQAAIIAAKVDAGRIINKQVIKQLKPHVPMLLRGYLDTPLAPVIAANVVAMIGNHTDNSKVKKVSELMLLGAADATVQSFNLDKIIDDVLAGIKLPAGFLDADDN